jgi:hypothetical protein
MADAGERNSSKKPFHERGSFKAAVALLGLVGGLWAFLGAPPPWQLARDLTDDPLPLRNAEIILDASAATGERFGDSTKLAVAAEAVGRYAAAGEDVGLALRRAGGSCEDAGGQLVGFNDGQGAKIKEEALAQKPGGDSNLTQAVMTAIGDFSGSSFHRSGSENVIVVFASSMDDCEGEAGELIRDALETAEIKASFELFAIDVSAATLKNLKTLERQLRPVAAVHLREADSAKELNDQVEEFDLEAEVNQEIAPEERTETTEGEAGEAFEEEEPEPTEGGSVEEGAVEEGAGEAEEEGSPEESVP